MVVALSSDANLLSEYLENRNFTLKEFKNALSDIFGEQLLSRGEKINYNTVTNAIKQKHVTVWNAIQNNTDIARVKQTIENNRSRTTPVRTRSQKSPIPSDLSSTPGTPTTSSDLPITTGTPSDKPITTGTPTTPSDKPPDEAITPDPFTSKPRSAARARPSPWIARRAGARAKSSGSGGFSSSTENPAGGSVDLNDNPPPVETNAENLMEQPVPTEIPDPVGEPQAKPSDKDEQEDAIGQATTESTRQNELAENEAVSLQYKPNFTEVMDASFMRLGTDESRGNLGAGTSAEMQSADLWGNQFTQHDADLRVEPERFLTTAPSGMTVEETGDADKTTNTYSFLPFAKLNGVLVWIPRHVKAAKLFFTADDYSELVSHIRDGDPLTLDKTEEVDNIIMMSTIIRSYGTLKQFCELGPMLPSTASIEQVYAEWLEMKQIGSAVARYEQITGGMYENTELSMKGGIRAAVASALRPFVEAWNRMHKNDQDQIATTNTFTSPGSAPMYSGKRKAEAGIIEPEEYNPQFSFQSVDLKRVKFSIPSI